MPLTCAQAVHVLTCTNLFMQDGGNWANSHTPKFSAMDPTYSLPDNVALLTLQVPARYITVALMCQPVRIYITFMLTIDVRIGTFNFRFF